MFQFETFLLASTLVTYSHANSTEEFDIPIPIPINSDSDITLTMQEEVSWPLLAVSTVAELAMIFGGVFPYIPQYREIHNSKDADGFSLYVCLALLSANILRILFWFGKPFETPLLLQSILMSIAMLTMIHLCVRTKARSDIIKKMDRTLSGSISSDIADGQIPQRRFIDFKLDHFWDWTDFRSYMECVFLFSVIGGLVMYAFCEVSFVVESIGFLAVFVEAMLGVPQFLRNHRNGSTRGMNQTMVIMWTCGDVFKTTYFLMRSAPIQFTICGCLQIGVDLAILAQVWIFGSKGGMTQVSTVPDVHLN